MNEIKLSYKGDEIYSINCTGDVVSGDVVKFERAVFIGEYRDAKFTGYELVCGEIIAESYGADKSQHTFTILLESGTKRLIKGRNLYKNGVFRKRWESEGLRASVAAAKHIRGDKARNKRDYERASNGFN